MSVRPDAAVDLSSLDRTDRILLAGAVVVWLVALGATVAAAVALVDLGTGHSEPSGSDTPWVLYVVIAISAVIIAGAVPLLLRARRQGGAATPAATGSPATSPPPARRAEMRTEKFRAPSVPAAEAGGPLPRAWSRPPGSPDSVIVDQLWLRCAASITCAMGAATFLVGASTYLMAADAEPVAWVLYGVAGVITVGMPAIPWYFLRELRAELQH